MENESTNETRPGLEKIRLWAFCLFVCAIISYVCAVLAQTNYPFWKDVFQLIAGALLTTSIFSVLLGFTDFVEYISIILRGIVVEHSYLRRLSEGDKENLKRKIDQAILGEATTLPTDSLYKFLDSQLGSLYKSQYRKEFHDMNYYKDSEKEGFWEVDSQLSYFLFQSLIKPDDLVVSYTRSFEIPGKGVGIEDIIINEEVSIGEDKWSLVKERCEPKDDHDDNCQDKGLVTTNTRFILKASDSNKIVKDDVELNVVEEVEGKKEMISTSFSIKLKRDQIRGKDCFLVEIKRKHLISKTENSLYLTMGYPTRDMLLSLHFKEGEYNTHAMAFGLNDEVCKYRRERSSAFVDVKEWLLPGHGAVITWQKAS